MASTSNPNKSRMRTGTSGTTNIASLNLGRLLPQTGSFPIPSSASRSAPEVDRPDAGFPQRHHPELNQRAGGQQQIGREDRQAQRSTGGRNSHQLQPTSSAEPSDDELLLKAPSRPSTKGKKRGRELPDNNSSTDGSDDAGRVPVKVTVIEERGTTQAVAAFNWTDFGRRYPRLMDPWDDINTVLTTGYAAMEAGELMVVNVLSTNGEVDQKETQKAKERQRRLYQVYCRVLMYKQSLHRTIRQALNNGDKDFIDTIATQMRTGSKSSRSADISSISHAIWKWIPHGNELETKERRGFQSPITGRLLMPAKKPFTMSLFDEYYNQTIRIKPTQIPRFCYDELSSEKTNGYFSKYLRYSAVLILHGPSCVDTSSGSLGLATKSSKGSKKSNADRCGVESMTPALLAYIAALVFYALTNATQFGPAPFAFPIQRFYHTVLKQFSDPQHAARNNKLLQRWDDFLWPGLHGDDSDDSDYDNFTEQSDDYGESIYSSDRDQISDVARSLVNLSRSPVAGPSTSRSYNYRETRDQDEEVAGGDDGDAGGDDEGKDEDGDRE